MKNHRIDEPHWGHFHGHGQESKINTVDSLWATARLESGKERIIMIRQFTGWMTMPRFTMLSFFCSGEVRDVEIEFRDDNVLIMERAPCELFSAASPGHSVSMHIDPMADGPRVIVKNRGKKLATIFIRLIGEASWLFGDLPIR